MSLSFRIATEKQFRAKSVLRPGIPSAGGNWYGGVNDLSVLSPLSPDYGKEDKTEGEIRVFSSYLCKKRIKDGEK